MALLVHLATTQISCLFAGRKLCISDFVTNENVLSVVNKMMPRKREGLAHQWKMTIAKKIHF